MHVQDTAGALTVKARVLPPPKLKYGPGSAQPTIVSAGVPLSYAYLSCLSLLDTSQRSMEHVSVVACYLYP